MVEKTLSTKRRRNLKPLLIILGIIILCVGGGVAFALLTHQAETSSEDEINTTVSDSSESSATETEKNTEVDNFTEVAQYEGDDPNELHELTGVITYSAVSGENLSIRVSIDQTLDSGACKLTLTSGSAMYMTEAAVIQSGATTSSCEGFDVPLAELTAGSEWDISIAIASGDKTGLIAGKANL